MATLVNEVALESSCGTASEHITSIISSPLLAELSFLVRFPLSEYVFSISELFFARNVFQLFQRFLSSRHLFGDSVRLSEQVVLPCMDQAWSMHGQDGNWMVMHGIAGESYYERREPLNFGLQKRMTNHHFLRRYYRKSKFG